MKIAVDIGGTNTRIAHIEKENNKILIIKQEDILTKDISSQEELLKLIDNFSNKNISGLAIAIAGKIINDEVRLTNNHLYLKKNEIEEHYNNEIEITLINDLEGIAYSLSTISKGFILPINTKEQLNLEENIGIIAPGTGLGEAYIRNGEVLASEDGHLKFFPSDSFELNMLKYFIDEKELSYETFLSGEGLVRIYKYFFQLIFNKELTEGILPELITHGAVEDMENENDDNLAIHTIKAFINILKNECENVYCRNNNQGSIVLTGNILNFLYPFLKNLDTPFPLYLLREKDPALYGLGLFL